MHLAGIKKSLLYFYYHLNCRHINDNAGDIKLGVTLSSQNTFYPCLKIKSHQNDATGRDLKCIWEQSINSC